MKRIRLAAAALLLGVLVSLTLPVEAQNVTNAVVIQALQAMGLFGTGYATGDFPVWNATSRKYLPSSGSGTVVAVFPATCAAAGTGIAITATPSVLMCVNAVEMVALDDTGFNITVPASAAIGMNAFSVTQQNTNGNGIGYYSPALGTTRTMGIEANNSTAAAAGAQQVSPSIDWVGQGWKTNAVAGSREVRFWSYVLPVEQAIAPSGSLKIGYKFAGGADVELLDLSADVLTNSANYSSPQTTFAAQVGVIRKGTDRFLHDFNYGNNGVVTTEGFNTFLGHLAGNFTTGSTATQTTDASDNTGIGYNALNALTVGHRNTTVGSFAGYQITSGNYNSCVGYLCLRDNTTAVNNVGLGYLTNATNSSGSDNTAVGHSSLALNTASNNTALGSGALQGNTTGSMQISVGFWAGRFLPGDAVNNSAGTNGVYLGAHTRPLAINGDHETILGTDAAGNGTYTAIVGNDKGGISWTLGDEPTCATNCGTSPSLTGNNSSFTLTMGATGSPASGFVVTFNTAGVWVSAPQCIGQMGKAGMVVTAIPLIVVTSTTTMTVTTNGTAPANGDIYHFHCSLGQ